MLRVMIADDEVNICALIRALIDWDALNLSFIGEAYTGSEAKELLFSQTPDIAVLDIRMPGIDGLEIVRQAHMAGLPTKFLLVSGHKNFEYAHTALNYGVERYLLKPIRKDELQENLCQISSQIRADQQDQIVIHHMKERLEQNADFYRKYLLYNLFEGKLEALPADVKSINAKYDAKFQPGAFAFVIVRLDGKMSYDVSQVDMLLNRIRDHFNESLDGEFFDMISMKQDCDIVAIVNGIDYDNILRSILRYFEHARKKWYPYGTLTVALSKGEASLSALKPDEAKRAIFSRLSVGTDRIIEFNGASSSNASLRTVEDQKAFINAFDALNPHPVDEWFEKKMPIMLNPSTDAYCLFKDFSRINSNLIGERLREFLSKDEFEQIMLRDEFELRQAATREALIDAFRDIFKRSLSRFTAEQKKAGSAYIQQTKKYIADHYAQNVTLEDIAKIVYVSPVYLSILFKKEEGINFSDYLLSVRIDKAKELLRKERKYNIDQISEQVGYQNSKYFSRLFTKQVGIKPSDYRRLYY